ncbi:MAG: hypothetical protein ACYC69_03145 [Thermodesulfovibrionales bacterium]
MSIWKLTDKEPVKITGKIPAEGTSPLMPENRARLSEDADLLVAAGEYFIAMELYRMLLRSDSTNTLARQRIEELRSLILLSGLQKDFMIFRLGRFRDLLRKRGTDFWKP